MRVLWSLPKAAPALLRHIAGYIELVGQDLQRAQHEFAAQLVALAVVALSGFFLILMICLAVVAATWDTAYRMTAIGWMGGVFLLLAILAVLYRGSVSRAQNPLLSTVRAEWQEDRVILERILASDQD